MKEIARFPVPLSGNADHRKTYAGSFTITGTFPQLSRAGHTWMETATAKDLSLQRLSAWRLWKLPAGLSALKWSNVVSEDVDVFAFARPSLPLPDS